MIKATILISFAVFLSIVSATPKHETVNMVLDSFMDKPVKELFKVWHLLFEKKYAMDSVEVKQRFANFKANLAYIKKKNLKESRTYKLGLNQFSDMTNEEFRAKMLNKKITTAEQIQQLVAKGVLIPYENDDDDLTKRRMLEGYAPIDHRIYLNPARHQLECGSCWAFSTAGAIEGVLGKSLRKPSAYLSTQQLVDCDTNNQGCEGGVFPYSFDYVTNYGVQSDSSYPYKAVQGYCNYNSRPLVRVRGFNYCSNYDGIPSTACTFDKVHALINQGPASVGIDAGPLQSYRSGLFTSSCQSDNHAVIAVGYGTCKDGDYFIVRNSWGATWGEAGHVRVKVNQSNKYSCFVANEVYLPLI